MPDELKTTVRRCDLCRYDRLLPVSSMIYERARWRGEILRATPPAVWRQYRDEGYSMVEAVEMELSYGG